MLAVVLLVSGTVACDGPEPSAGPGAPAEENGIVSLINERRAQAGCPALTADERLTAAARRHAADMRDRGVRDHTGSDGSTAQRRIADAGFTPATATGEILYWSEGAADAGAAVAAWMDSPAHRDVIGTCRFTHAGAGVVTPGYAAVVDFAAH